MKRFYILFTFILLGAVVHAQQYPLFTNFMINKYGYNPAIHTDTIGICANVVYRNQWSGIEGAPETMIAGLRGTVRPLPIGVGGYFFNDRAGVIRRSGGYGMFNIVRPLGTDTRISVGAAIGMYSFSLEKDFKVTEEVDQVIPNALDGKQFADFNAGVYFEHQNFYAGFSIPQIAERELSFSDAPDKSVLKRHYYSLVGYRHDVSQDFAVEPMALFKFTDSSPMQWDAGIKFIFQHFWLGGTYRKTDAVTAMAGLRLGELELAYAYDVTTSALKSNSNGSHEISAQMWFGRPKDSDGDGCLDKDDPCPDKAGPKENNCCPEEEGEDDEEKDDDTVADSDGDGILDDDDKCPNIPGIPELDGCPFGDRDGDGIRNDIDRCPDLPGVASNQGCPIDDRDQDGIVDKFDRCPDEPGPLANHGCPDGDMDGDGIPDSEDRCPNTKGLPANGGCPIASATETETLDLAIRNLYFDTDKSDIWESSYPFLDRLAKVMLEHKDWQLRISGHTDARASIEYNLALSKRRSEAVMFFLMNRGLKRNQLIVEYYGENAPAATNASEGGMQLNRRVEMEFIFD